MKHWRETIKIQKLLESDGWKSPDTYCNHFAEPSAISSLYLFMMIKTECFDEALVAYVGMSTNLEKRWNGHEILTQITKPGVFIKRWFKPTPVDKLRSTEKSYIHQFNPPWNVIGRPRGLIT